MGRKTYESIGRRCPAGQHHRDASGRSGPAGCHVVTSLDEALILGARMAADGDVMVGAVEKSTGRRSARPTGCM